MTKGFKRFRINAVVELVTLNVESLKWLPARLHAEEVAFLLGFEPSDIGVLISKKLLKPLGKPAPNAPKYFARFEIEALARSRDWLNRATLAMSKYWQTKNNRKTGLQETRSAHTALAE